MEDNNLVYIYSDGSALGNPGPGGYGVILQFGSEEKELQKGFKYTTNNRMELLGAIVGLELLKKSFVSLNHSYCRSLRCSLSASVGFSWVKSAKRAHRIFFVL